MQVLSLSRNARLHIILIKQTFFQKIFARFCLTSGKSETKNGKNKDIFEFRGVQGLPVWLSLCGGGRAHWLQVVQASRVCRWSFGACSCLYPCLLSLSCIPFPAIVLYYALFRILRGFLEGFGVRMYICMGWVLCVDCGAFYVRE